MDAIATVLEAKLQDSNSPMCGETYMLTHSERNFDKKSVSGHVIIFTWQNVKASLYDYLLRTYIDCVSIQRKFKGLLMIKQL